MRTTGESDFLIYGLLFLAIVGFNILKQVLAARREQQARRARAAQREQATQPTQSMRHEELAKPIQAAEPAHMPELTESDWGRTSEPEPVETHWGRTSEAEPMQPVVVPLVKQPLEVLLARERDRSSMAQLAAARQSRHTATSPVRARRRLLHDRQDLRHGIVLMTVLGPCRALQPYDENHG